jgi:hypothetical protein
MLALGLAVAGVLVVGGVLVPSSAPDRPGAPERATASSPTPDDRTAPLSLLREWDRARAIAWREGDPHALAQLYVAGSTAGRADRRLLAAYADRGLRVTGVRMQVATVDVLRATDDRISLLVTDRLAGVTARGGPHPVELPRDRWSRRRVVMVRVGEQWRVSEVSDHARPAARTAATSGSSKR